MSQFTAHLLVGANVHVVGLELAAAGPAGAVRFKPAVCRVSPKEDSIVTAAWLELNGKPVSAMPSLAGMPVPAFRDVRLDVSAYWAQQPTEVLSRG